MKIYFVVRWGHDESPDGPNGEDTHFIVKASDHDEAAAIVDFYLEHSLHHSQVEPICNVIVELGSDVGTRTDPLIIHGPWYSYAYLQTGRDYPSWIREVHTEYQWGKFDELYPPEGT